MKKINLKDGMYKFMAIESSIVFSLLIFLGIVLYGVLAFIPFSRYVDDKGVIVFFSGYRTILMRGIIVLVSLGYVYAFSKLFFRFKVNKKLKEMDKK